MPCSCDFGELGFHLGIDLGYCFVFVFWGLVITFHSFDSSLIFMALK